MIISLTKGESFMKKYDIAIVGGGASGLMAALSAEKKGAKVVVLERNPRVGKKILATGNGRCNYTNTNIDIDYYHSQNPEFAYGALGIFDISRTMGFFEKLGIYPMIEDKGKVFPRSGQASSILNVLLYELENSDVKIECNTLIKDIKKTKVGFEIMAENGNKFSSKAVILACGGKAMPSSGSDGTGFILAEKLGHSIVDVFPALVQLKLQGRFFKQIQGVKFSGKAELFSGSKKLCEDFGDILFTNYGISGPPILQLSRHANKLLLEGKSVTLKISIFYDKTFKEMENLLKERFRNMENKPLNFSLEGLINKRLIPVILKEAGISEITKPVRKLLPKECKSIAKILVDWRFKVTSSLGWQNAQVTAGGVDTQEVDPFTMESKKIEGLYFAGEILDIDGDCGGFNLQWAWSSGFIAGAQAALNIKKRA